jgi:putative transposase
MYGKLRQYLGELLRDLARQQGCEILEGHLQPDHIHILISIPPKLSLSKVMGYIKGKSAIAIARTYIGAKTIQGRVFGPEDIMSAQ